LVPDAWTADGGQAAEIIPCSVPGGLGVSEQKAEPQEHLT
jgi:hypothetical protein